MSGTLETENIFIIVECYVKDVFGGGKEIKI